MRGGEVDCGTKFQTKHPLVVENQEGKMQYHPRAANRRELMSHFVNDKKTHTQTQEPGYFCVQRQGSQLSRESSLSG